MSIDFADIFSKEGTVNIMREQNNFSASALISSLTWLIITTIILIASLIVHFISVLDENAAEDVHKRVEVAFNVEKESLLTLNVEYSFWDESYQSTVVNRDQKWIDKTYKNYLLPAYNLSYVAAIEKDLTVHMLAGSKLHGPSAERSILDSSLLERLMATHRGSRTLQKIPFFTKQDDRVYLVSAEPFRDEKSENTIDGSHLVLGKALTQKYLNEISKKYQLPELRYSTDKI
ncbi:CHASE4 domain-containing protein, partial [Vibrio rotiferianus]